MHTLGNWDGLRQDVQLFGLAVGGDVNPPNDAGGEHSWLFEFSRHFPFLPKELVPIFEFLTAGGGGGPAAAAPAAGPTGRGLCSRKVSK